ncbi:MAG: IS1595 family transposase [Dehalococcoidia bacterium]|nr:IS1595 family transposase [Dehalococcoidia bacterium]
MSTLRKCPRCGNTKSWRVRRSKRKCSACRYEWRTDRLPLHLSRAEWKRLLRWFLLGLSSAATSREAGLGREQVLRALTMGREAMVRDIPPVFEGVVEIDETYLGGSWRNKRKSTRIQGSKRGRGTSKQAVFGILCRSGQVWAEVVPNVEANTLIPLLRKQVAKGSIVCSDTFRSYTGVAARGYVHRFVKHDQQEYVDAQGNHINGLEGFWGYPTRKLVAKGGIRRERLPLYLAEYVWRHNHRNMEIKDQIKLILSMLQNKYKFSG